MLGKKLQRLVLCFKGMLDRYAKYVEQQTVRTNECSLQKVKLFRNSSKLKTRQHAQNEVTCAKPHISKPRYLTYLQLQSLLGMWLIASQYGITWSALVRSSAQKTISIPNRKVTLSEIIHSSIKKKKNSFSCSPLPIPFIFLKLFGGSLYLLMGCCLIHELLRKSIKIFKFYSTEFSLLKEINRVKPYMLS